MRVLQDKYKIGLLSNIYKDMWPLLKTKGIVPDIEYSSAILSCDAGFGKPSEAIYELALKSAGVKPNEILYVDDKGINLAPAQQAGWNIVPFNMLYPSKTVSLIYSLVEKL